MTHGPSLLGTGFTYTTEIQRHDGRVERAEDHNLLPQEAIDFVAGLLRGSEAAIGNWYVGLFESNTVPDAAFKAADLPSLLTECTAYDEATRPAWTHSYDGKAVIDSLGNKATFTFNQAKRIYGAFIVSTSTKGGSGGRLLSIARFASPKDIDAGEPFTLAAGLTLIPTSL